MAMSSQFSLSVELTKLVPFGSLLSTAGRGLLHLMRELQDSGSDFITEADLAEVFGRNRIDPRFESSFRTAVKQSVVHKVSEIAELVIEGGAGPTVRRSLNDPVYFATVVQLSLLTYTHELSQLARALAKALEIRAKGATETVSLPRHDAVKGTLRACREQTCGYMWELCMIPVEKKLEGIMKVEDPFSSRSIPMPVLQALLDSFTAVQYLPENRFINIETMVGMSTVVVWAHHILGLTVCVESERGVVHFGDGFESVHIYTSQGPEAKANLVNETQDLIFRVVESDEDMPMGPTCRHPVLGYGTRILELEQYESDTMNGIALATVTSCLSLAQKESVRPGNVFVERREQDICPSLQRILVVGKILFPNQDDLFDGLDLSLEQPCLAPSDWKTDMLPDALARYVQNRGSKNALRRSTLQLSYLLLVLSMVENIDTSGALSLEIYSLKKEHYLPFRLPNAREAFDTLALLLQGQTLASMPERKEIAVISAWGWSLCVSSVVGTNLSDMRAGIAVFQGVPSRTGERKRLVIDSCGFVRARPREGVAQQEWAKAAGYKSNNYEAVAMKGDKISLESWTRSEKTRYFISVTDTAFEVMKLYKSTPIQDAIGASGKIAFPYPGELRAGFRSMQEAYWNSVRLTTCDHSAWLGQIATIPKDTWVFRGVEEPDREFVSSVPDVGPASRDLHEWAKCNDGTIHVGLVAGDNAAQWILLVSMLNHWKILKPEITATKSKSGSEDENVNSTIEDQISWHRKDGSYRDGLLKPETVNPLNLKRKEPTPLVLLRSEECCFQCALDVAQDYRQGQHIGLVL